MIKYNYKVQVENNILQLVRDLVSDFVPNEDLVDLDEAIQLGGPVTLEADYNVLLNPRTTAKVLSAKAGISRLVKAVQAELPALVEAGKALAGSASFKVVGSVPGKQDTILAQYDGVAQDDPEATDLAS